MKILNKICLSYPKTLSFILGGIAVQALPPYYHWYLLFICFSVILYLIHKAQNLKQAFNYGYWYGFSFFAFGLFWVNNALLVDAPQTGWLVPIVFFASGGFFGLFIAIPSLLSKLNKSLYAQYLSLAAWIVIFEWIRSWFLTGFPWNLWGSCLAFNLPLIQTASIFGTYGLSLFLILITSAPTLWYIHPSRKTAVLSTGIVLIGSCLLYGYGLYRIQKLNDNSNSNITIRLVQPSIPQSLKWSPELSQKHFQQYINLSQSQTLNNIDMVIWGETASPYMLDLDINARNQALNAIADNSYLLTGLVRYHHDYYGSYQPLNSSLIINKSGQIEDFYDKSHLVPFGEYIPLREYLPSSIRPITNTITNFKSGNGPKIINLPNIPPFGIQICYEIIFPHHIIDSQNKPQWLINLTNDGWYGISSGPYQHMVSTQLRAIEEGLTIVRSANSGISGIINRYGKILSSLNLNQTGILDISLPQQLQVSTFYNNFGNFTTIILCLINILISAFINYKMK